jgi:hypothetical protein
MGRLYGTPRGRPGASAIDTDPLGEVRDRGRAFASLGSQEPNNRMLGFGAAEVVLKLKQMAEKRKS